MISVDAATVGTALSLFVPEAKALWLLVVAAGLR